MTPDTASPSMDALRHKRYRQAARLLEKWAEEDAQYDQRVGEALERELGEVLRCEDNDAPAP